MASALSDSLYVSNLSYNTSTEVLKQSFPGCIDAQIIIDKETNRSKGYGFVRFTAPDDAQKVLDSVGGPGGTRQIDGRDVKINYAHSKDKSGQSQGRGGGFSNRGGRGGYNRGGYNQGGFNSWNQDQAGYNGNYVAQPSYSGQQTSYNQGDYSAGGQGSYSGYGGQAAYTQPADSSAYGGDQQGQSQNWQQQGQQQSWQQPQQSWPQGQQAGQQYASGDYQSQSTAAYPSQQQRGNWGGNYQQ